MRVRPFLILSLFVLSAGVLVWIYHAATRPSSSRVHSPWVQIRTDLGECARRKNAQSAQYERYADIASIEGRMSAEPLFRAVAYSERVQERNCTQAIERLGGQYQPPVRVVVFRGVTPDNLDRSIASKELLLGNASASAVGRAIGRGNRYAARVLIWSAAADRRQVELMRRCRERLDAGGGVSVYWACPVCGNLYEATSVDRYCPQCLTGKDEFVRIE